MELYNKNLDLRIFFSFLEKKTQHKMMVMLKLLNCFQCYLCWKKPGDRVSVIPFQDLFLGQESQKELNRWFEILQGCSNMTGLSSSGVMLKP